MPRRILLRLQGKMRAEEDIVLQIAQGHAGGGVEKSAWGQKRIMSS